MHPSVVVRRQSQGWGGWALNLFEHMLLKRRSSRGLTTIFDGSHPDSAHRYLDPIVRKHLGFRPPAGSSTGRLCLSFCIVLGKVYVSLPVNSLTGVLIFPTQSFLVFHRFGRSTHASFLERFEAEPCILRLSFVDKAKGGGVGL